MADLRRHLVLFDIDSTLLHVGGAGRRAVKTALEATWGPVPHADTWKFGGKTDPQIVYELLGHAGVAREAIDRLLPTVLERYLEQLAIALPQTPAARLMPGVEPLLDALAQEPGVVLGLLTGNLAEGARIKLAHFGLGERFVLGAFGSDHADRPELPAIAVARAEALTGRLFSGKEIVVIGDTPHDVACGQSLGVKAIAVATGSFDLPALAACRPDALLPDLSDTERALSAILG